MTISRYAQTRVVKDPTISEPAHYETYDLPETVKGLNVADLLANQQFTQYVWQVGDRLDKLSSKYLGDDDYWWVLALVNEINYGLGVAPGTVIRVPVDIDSVLTALGLF